MRDYWLTQYILSAIGWGYLTAVLIVVALVLWLVKGKTAKTICLLVVIGLASVLPLQGYKEYAKEKEAEAAYRVRLAKAQALFDERCKTAGEKIYKTVENVEGILAIRARPEKINLSDQYALDDPYGRDFGGEDYVASFLWGRNSNGTFTQSHKLNTYKFVELQDTEKKVINRYEVMQISSPADVPSLKLKTEVVKTRSAQYGVNWADLSTKQDRDQWIAGSSLQVIDLTSGEVIAERIGFMFDRALGDQNGGRSPWAYAEYQACPTFDKSTGGYPSKTSRSRGFVFRVLKPIKNQGE